MTIQEQISIDLKEAMISKNDLAKSILRVIIGEFNRVDKTVNNEQALGILKKMHFNAIEQKNQAEASLIEKYIPQQLNSDELKNIINSIISKNGYSSLKDMGKIMSELKNSHNGKYDGKLANDIVKSLFV